MANQPMNIARDVVRDAWNRIRAHLERERDRINEEIGCYPTPIAGCDQQFNFLLEQRSGIAEEWTRLNQREVEGLSAADPAGVLEEFIRSSIHIHREVAESVRLTVKNGIAESGP